MDFQLIEADDLTTDENRALIMEFAPYPQIQHNQR
jgi:hypothetical protein